MGHIVGTAVLAVSLLALVAPEAVALSILGGSVYGAVAWFLKR